MDNVVTTQPGKSDPLLLTLPQAHALTGLTVWQLRGLIALAKNCLS